MSKTFGVKVPDEVHQEASNLQKISGLSGEEFLNTLLEAYKTEKTKEEIPMIARDITELQGLVHRIYNIYLNLGYSIENISNTKDEEMRGKLEKKDSLITSLQEEVNQLDEENEKITTAFNNAVEDKNILEHEVNQLTDMLSSNKELIQEYKNKNDMLLGQLTQYEKYPEKLEATKELLSKQQEDNIALTDNLKQRDYTIEQLKAKNEEIIADNTSELDKLKTSHSEELTKLNKEHNNALQVLKDKFDLEKEKAILKLKQIHQQELEKIQNKYNVDIAKYNTDYKNILEEMSKIKQINKRTTQSNRQEK